MLLLIEDILEDLETARALENWDIVVEIKGDITDIFNGVKPRGYGV